MEKNAARTLSTYSLPPVAQLPHLLWAVLSILGMGAGAFVGGLLCGIIFKSGSAIAFGVAIFGAVGGLGTLWFGLCHRLKWTLADFGFRTSAHSLWHLVWWAPLTLLMCVTATAIVGSLFEVAPSKRGLDESLHLGMAPQVAVVFCSVLALPFLEEVFFRRVLLDWFQRFTPVWVAGLISVSAFAVAHVSPPVMIYTLLLGTSLTLARFWFKTLKAPFLIHAFNNLVVSIVILVAM